jgi:hypothetical protein
LQENGNLRPAPEFQFYKSLPRKKDHHQRKEENIIISPTKKRADEKIRAV